MPNVSLAEPSEERVSLQIQAGQGFKPQASDEVSLSQNAVTVLEKRYLVRDERGQLTETPRDMFWRVANNIAQADLLYDEQTDVSSVAGTFYDLMTSFEFMPNSPTLMNAGRQLQQLSACFVLPIEDSMESIFESVKNTALIHKSGGGTGFSFSRLRPKDDIVSTTHGYSSGPVSFMRVFDQATHAVNQGGFRRGANMGIMRVDHPDILEFIKCKSDQTHITNFNISVGITDAFMEAVKTGADYELVNPRTQESSGTLNAKEVHDLIVSMAWKNGEPGVVFMDRINRDNPTPHLGEIESTNPCGEQPLLPYEACNLGSINLSTLVRDKQIDFEKLKRIVRTAVHFLDNVIDMSRFPIPEITQMVQGNRKIGLGVMGFADMLLKLEIPYDSEEALLVAESVMESISKEAVARSAEIAENRGVFPNFTGSLFDKPDGEKVRNATVTTIAPTGTVSIISGCSSGIEPLFAVSFVRNVLDGNKLLETNPLFEAVARRECFYSAELMETIAERGSVQGITEVPEHVQRLFVTAHDISPEWHVKMQAAFQKYTDNAVSKTVNFHSSATPSDVDKAYVLAFDSGCKGITIYRDGSRDQQVLTVGHTTKTPDESGPKEEPMSLKRNRPRMLQGRSIQMVTGCGNVYITINEDEHGAFELFNNMGKAGGCASSQCEAIGRLVSLAWRSGIPTESIVKQLIGISCHQQTGIGQNKILSCSDAIAKAIQIYVNGGKSQDTGPIEQIEHRFQFGACPECGGVFEPEGGCFVCRSCAYSKCG